MQCDLTVDTYNLTLITYNFELEYETFTLTLFYISNILLATRSFRYEWDASIFLCNVFIGKWRGNNTPGLTELVGLFSHILYRLRRTFF